MARPLRYGPPLKTRLLPEDEARFAAECERRGITRSELAREMIGGGFLVSDQIQKAEENIARNLHRFKQVETSNAKVDGWKVVRVLSEILDDIRGE